MTSSVLLLVVVVVGVTIIVEVSGQMQPQPQYPNHQQNHFSPPNYGYGQGNYPYGYPFNQYNFPQLQYPFYPNYNGMSGIVTTSQTGLPGSIRETEVVETLSKNPGPGIGGQIFGNQMLGGVMSPGFSGSGLGSGIPNQPAVVQSNTVLEVENQRPSGHYELYQYGRDGLGSELFHESRSSYPDQRRRIQRPFSVQKKPHYDLYKWARSEPIMTFDQWE